MSDELHSSGEATKAESMFWYVFSVGTDFSDPDDLRIIEDRGEALMYRHILPRLPFRVIHRNFAKGQLV